MHAGGVCEHMQMRAYDAYTVLYPIMSAQPGVLPCSHPPFSFTLLTPLRVDMALRACLFLEILLNCFVFCGLCMPFDWNSVLFSYFIFCGFSFCDFYFLHISREVVLAGLVGSSNGQHLANPPAPTHPLTHPPTPPTIYPPTHPPIHPSHPPAHPPTRTHPPNPQPTYPSLPRLYAAPSSLPYI